MEYHQGFFFLLRSWRSASLFKSYVFNVFIIVNEKEWNVGWKCSFPAEQEDSRRDTCEHYPCRDISLLQILKLRSIASFSLRFICLLERKGGRKRERERERSSTCLLVHSLNYCSQNWAGLNSGNWKLSTCPTSGAGDQALSYQLLSYIH